MDMYRNKAGKQAVLRLESELSTFSIAPSPNSCMLHFPPFQQRCDVMATVCVTHFHKKKKKKKRDSSVPPRTKFILRTTFSRCCFPPSLPFPSKRGVVSFTASRGLCADLSACWMYVIYAFICIYEFMIPRHKEKNNDTVKKKKINKKKIKL
ncbi:hypothetical protein I7I48_03825 [Histoplasma ohiense]|nr:hypothetical protein I7I48_03825 [Histoplasma ohiense (nom. inval.)]